MPLNLPRHVRGVRLRERSHSVIAIDNDETRLMLARHNALHLGVADRIEFILADFVDFARSRRDVSDLIDVVFLSPPWGKRSLSH
jgi:23S rRNA G2445 N2-methylase RlmL